MKEIVENDVLLSINGGIKISGSMINAIVGTVKIIFEIGKALGSSIRRSRDNKLCPI